MKSMNCVTPSRARRRKANALPVIEDLPNWMLRLSSGVVVAASVCLAAQQPAIQANWRASAAAAKPRAILLSIESATGDWLRTHPCRVWDGLTLEYSPYFNLNVYLDNPTTSQIARVEWRIDAPPAFTDYVVEVRDHAPYFFSSPYLAPHTNSDIFFGFPVNVQAEHLSITNNVRGVVGSLGPQRTSGVLASYILQKKRSSSLKSGKHVFGIRAPRVVSVSGEELLAYGNATTVEFVQNRNALLQRGPYLLQDFVCNYQGDLVPRIHVLMRLTEYPMIALEHSYDLKDWGPRFRLLANQGGLSGTIQFDYTDSEGVGDRRGFYRVRGWR